MSLDDLTLPELRLALAPAVATAAVFDGWSDIAVDTAAIELGVAPAVARLAFPGGATDLIGAWIDRIDADAALALPQTALAALRVPERIRRLVEFRIDAVAGREEALRRALAILAMPQNLAQAARLGWRSADLHVHMNYGGTYRATPRTLLRMARAEDLDLVENLIVNKEGRIPDIERPVGRDPVSTATTLIVHDQEFHTSVWGHVGLLGLRDHVLLPGYSGYQGTAAASLVPTNAEVADLPRAQGGIMGYVHPFDSDPIRPIPRVRSPPNSRWISRWARSTTTRRWGSWTIRWRPRTSGIAR